MRTVRPAVLAFAIASFALGGALAAPAQESSTAAPMKFGAPVTVKKALPIAKLEKKPSRYEGKTIRIEGVVQDVCQGAGCWISVGGPNGASFLAKSLDESVLVPNDCKGRKVIVQGVVTRLAAQGHDDHEIQEMEAGHSCPAPNYVVATQGVELHPRP